MRVRCRHQNSHKVTKVYTYCPLFAPFLQNKKPRHKPGAVRELSSKRRQVFRRIYYHLS